MSAISISVIVFACLLLGTALGMALRDRLPAHHLSTESRDVVKLAMGLIATMAALVLGLLTGSAKGVFDAEAHEIEQSATNVVVLDRVLAHYGPETQDIRDGLRRGVVFRLNATWPEDGSPTRVDTPESMPAAEGIEQRIRALTPQNETQRALQAQAVQLAAEIERMRWLIFGQAGVAVQMPLLVVLVFWLAALFASFGLFAPRNGTVIAALFVAALSVSGAIFLILEMNQPLTGLVKVSSAPLRYTLSQLGK